MFLQIPFAQAVDMCSKIVDNDDATVQPGKIRF